MLFEEEVQPREACSSCSMWRLSDRHAEAVKPPSAKGKGHTCVPQCGAGRGRGESALMLRLMLLRLQLLLCRLQMLCAPMSASAACFKGQIDYTVSRRGRAQLLQAILVMGLPRSADAFLLPPVRLCIIRQHLFNLGLIRVLKPHVYLSAYEGCVALCLKLQCVERL